MTTASLNGTALATAVPEAAILSVSRQLGGARRDTLVDVPGRAGAWHFTEEPGNRTVELVMHLEGDGFAARRAAVRALAAWADTPNGYVELIIDDEPDRFYEVVLAEAPNVDEWLRAAAVTLPFSAAPYALAVSTSSESATASSGGGDTFSALDELYTPAIITVTANGGAVSGFDFTMNGDTLSWQGQSPLGDGDAVTINGVSFTVTEGANIDTEVRGAYDSADLIMSGVTGTFPMVKPGTNTWSITYTGDATSVTVDILWRRRYR